MGGMPGGGSRGGPNMFFSASTGGSPGGGGGFPGFGFTDPSSLFEQFLRQNAGFKDDDDYMPGFSYSSSPLGGGRQGSFSSSRYGKEPNGRSKTPEATILEKPIAFTLEELFHGTRKKLRVKRKLFDQDGKIMREDKDLEIQVKPGMKAGSKFKFRGVGDEIDGTKQDLHFIVEEVSRCTLSS